MRNHKYTFLLLTTLFASCNCQDVEPLSEVMGMPCHTSYKGEVIEIDIGSEEYTRRNKGICHTGLTHRDSNGLVTCVNEKEAEVEKCNNLDDDCDGFVDNEYYNYNGVPLLIPYYYSENTCVGPGVCAYTNEVCLNGQWECMHPPGYGKENCDGEDNDCDGEVDEDTEDDPIFPPEYRYVYTADTSTINIGECRAGYRECVNGRTYIRNMRTPVREICGNGDDDDCDGFTDEDENDNEQTDFALIIDYSGSMSTVINSVASALCNWSQQGVLTTSRFAVIAIGFWNVPDEMIRLTDFTDSQTACQVIRANNLISRQGGTEYQLDAVYMSSDVDNPDNRLSLSWSGNGKRILIFSDEELQQKSWDNIDAAIASVTEQCLNQDYSIGAFIGYSTYNQTQWVDLVQTCNGFYDYLSNNPDTMIETLNYWVGKQC